MDITADSYSPEDAGDEADLLTSLSFVKGLLILSIKAFLYL